MADETNTASNVTPARTRNRWGEGDRLRGEILDAAGRLLSELGGEDGLTIRGVARAAGIAPASIYQHFADRTALVQGLLEHQYSRLLALMRAADEDHDPADVVGRVHAQVHAYCTFAIDNPGLYRLMTRNGAHRSTPGSRPSGPLMAVIDMLSAAFQRCADVGHPLRMPSDRAGVMVFVGTHGRVALLHSTSGAKDPQEVLRFIDELVALILD